MMKEHNQTTPFPNYLLDEVCPRLKGSEWNLLCLIVRQTCGWRDREGGRKGSDWLTHRQIKQRTGLASASISAAIDSLVKQRLIEVRDYSGRALSSAAERRRAARLCFSLRSLHDLDRVAFQKVKTTKETRKDMDNFVVFKNEKAMARPVSINEKPAALLLSDDLIQILRRYQDMYHSRFPEQMPPVRQDDLLRLQALVDKHGLEKVVRAMKRFFESHAVFLMRQSHSLAAFTHSTNFFL